MQNQNWFCDGIFIELGFECGDLNRENQQNQWGRRLIYEIGPLYWGFKGGSAGTLWSKN